MNKNLITRILVAAVAIPAILWISYRGGEWLLGMISLFAVIAMIEYLFNEGFKPDGLMFWVAIAAFLLIFGNLTGVLSASILGDQTTAVLIGLIGFFLIAGMLLSIGKESPAVLFSKHSRLIWGIIYVGLLYPFVYHVGMGINGWHGGDSLLFLFGLLWIGDTAAMEIGRRLGKHKLAPAISPNKTVEGFIGGLIAALAIAVLMHFWRFKSVPVAHMLIIALGCSIFGQLGDLVESMWKRSLNIKDSSNIIPGHGGVLDRFDSLLFAAPFMFAYINLVLP